MDILVIIAALTCGAVYALLVINTQADVIHTLAAANRQQADVIRRLSQGQEVGVKVEVQAPPSATASPVAHGKPPSVEKWHLGHS